MILNLCSTRQLISTCCFVWFFLYKRYILYYLRLLAFILIIMCVFAARKSLAAQMSLISLHRRPLHSTVRLSTTVAHLHKWPVSSVQGRFT